MARAGTCSHPLSAYPSHASCRARRDAAAGVGNPRCPRGRRAAIQTGPGPFRSSERTHPTREHGPIQCERLSEYADSGRPACGPRASPRIGRAGPARPGVRQAESQLCAGARASRMRHSATEPPRQELITSASSRRRARKSAILRSISSRCSLASASTVPQSRSR